MALPPAASSRVLKHRRRIDLHVHAREDGLWEVDAEISDIKMQDQRLAGGVRRTGEPIHDMLLRVVVDTRFNIVAAGAQTRASPYPGACEGYGDAYERLVGLNLMQGFRAAVRERLGGVGGCTHVTELAQVLPTAVVQAFAGEVVHTRDGRSDGRAPFQLGRCHALRLDGEAVRTHYPRWYQPAVATPTSHSRASEASHEDS